MAKTNFAKDMLKSLVERVERLTDEKKNLAKDIGEVFAEAKGHGFDTKIMRLLIRRRAMDAAELSTQDEMLDLYESAVSGNYP